MLSTRVIAVIAVLLMDTLLLPARAANSPAAVPSSTDRIIETFYEMREEAVTIREEAQRIRQEGYTAISKAYQLTEDAYELKDSAYETRSGLESLLVEVFTLLKSQTTATGSYIYDIRNTLTTVASRMDRLETKIDGLENKLEEKTEAIENKLEEKTEAIENKLEEKTEAIENKLEEKTEAIENKLEEKTEAIENMIEEKTGAIEQQTEELKNTVGELKNDLSAKVEASIALSTTVKDRQQAWLSEIRLISLYKMVDQNNPHSAHASGMVTDGNFVHSVAPGEMRTHSHTSSRAHDNKLWINLGGLFRIHRVYIWNYRNCCLDQLVGTHIYADQELIGTVVQDGKFHDFLIPDGDPTYASTITLHQPLPRHIHVMEVQVWGAGPFNPDDLFA